MTGEMFWQSLVNGISMGMIYVLIASWAYFAFQYYAHS